MIRQKSGKSVFVSTGKPKMPVHRISGCRRMLLWCLLILGSLQSPAQDASSGDLQKQTIIAERSSRPHVTRTILSVDGDDVVHEIDERPTGSGKTTIAGNLGTRITRSGNIELASVLPPGKVATYARRVTLPDGAIVHVIVAWGFPKDPDSQAAYCSLFVLLEKAGKVRLLLSQEDMGTYLEQVVVEDINNDGKTEVLITAREDHEESMWIFQVEPAGEIRFIQRIDAESLPSKLGF
jgi:hypothetical protein